MVALHRAERTAETEIRDRDSRPWEICFRRQVSRGLDDDLAGDPAGGSLGVQRG